MTGYYSPQLGEPDHDDDDEHDEDEDEDDLGYQVGQRGQSLTGRGGWGALHDAVHPRPLVNTTYMCVHARWTCGQT